MTTKEREEKVALYMKKLQLSREEAIALIEDDENDEIGEEGEEMTQKAKQLKRYEQSTKERKKVVKERKVDEEKKGLIEILTEAIKSCGENITVKNEAEISFNFNESAYTIKLVKHRPPKK